MESNSTPFRLMSRPLIGLILLLFTLNCYAKLEIDRTWNQGSYGVALVTYTNDTGKALKTGAFLKCIAFDKNKKKIGVQERGFFAMNYDGPIKSGFSDSVEVPVHLHGMKMKSMKCSVYSEL